MKRSQIAYLDRCEKALGIAMISAPIALITQLIPVAFVRYVGMASVGIGFLAMFAIQSGLLGLGLPKDED
ncbi:MAG: hypothetical protein AAF125_13620 [Chloroflexota bacterium]